MNIDDEILVLGARGLVGSAIVRELRRLGFRRVLAPDRHTVDLTERRYVYQYIEMAQPKYVFLAAAYVGGILHNAEFPARFLSVNLQIQTNVLDACAHEDCKVLFLGSSCIYPKHAPQPMRPEHLMTGPLEPTNDAYALAKLAGIRLCSAYRQENGSNFISCLPSNVYGPNDNFDEQGGHVLAAMLTKFRNAKISGTPPKLWGDGSVRREFLYADDLAAACVLLMERYDAPEPVNIGGEEIYISDLAVKIADVVGYNGAAIWDTSQPNGTPRKKLDDSVMRSMGWEPRFDLDRGLWTVNHLLLTNSGRQPL